MNIKPNIRIEGAANRPLLMDLYEADSPNGHLVVFSHGFKGFKDWGCWRQVAKYFAANGFYFIKFNYSHNGTTIEDPLNFGDLKAFGENTFSKEMEDLDRVLGYVRDAAISYQKIHLIGHSRSAPIVLTKGMEDPAISTVTTWAGVAELDKMLDRYALDQWKKEGVIYIENSRTKQKMPLYYSLFEDYISNEERFNLAKQRKTRKMPLHFIHGEQDEAVPLSAVYQLKEYYPWGQVDIIPGAGHTFGCQHPQSLPLPDSAQRLLEITSDWILQQG